MSAASSDRNLLFGILALQADLISRDSLIAAMSSWASTKATPLGQILLAQGALHTDGHALVEALVRIAGTHPPFVHPHNPFQVSPEKVPDLF